MPPQRILVVDDNTGFRESLAFRLRIRDYIVFEAENGIAALALLNDEPDLAIIERNMPRMNGIQLLHTIRASERFHSLPVIIMTGGEPHEKRMEALNAGANDFLTKPFYIETLLQKIEMILGRVSEEVME